jgi:hypothetical protein
MQRSIVMQRSIRSTLSGGGLRYRVPQGRGPRVCVTRKSCNTSVTCGVRKAVDVLQKCNVRNQKSSSRVTHVRLAGWGQNVSGTFRHPSSSRRDLIPPVLSGANTSDDASPLQREFTDTEGGYDGHEEENLTLSKAQQPGGFKDGGPGSGLWVWFRVCVFGFGYGYMGLGSDRWVWVRVSICGSGFGFRHVAPASGMWVRVPIGGSGPGFGYVGPGKNAKHVRAPVCMPSLR